MSMENLAKAIDDDNVHPIWNNAAGWLEHRVQRLKRQSRGVKMCSKKLRHLSEVHAELRFGKGTPLVADSRSENLEGAYYDVIEKIESQIRRRKGKRLKRLKRRGKMARLHDGEAFLMDASEGGLCVESS